MSVKEDQEVIKQQTVTRPIDVPGQMKPFQTAQGPRIPGSNYSYPSAQTGSVYGAAAATGTGQGRRLVISEGITMSGEIESCDYVLVEGTLEAALKGASVLEVAQTGTFYGTVEIDEATIAGCFEGDITVNGRLTITSTGSITGSVAYKELAVEAGATVDGKVVPLVAKATAGKKADKPGSKVDARSAKVPQNGQRSGEGDGNELPFSSGNAAAA